MNGNNSYNRKTTFRALRTSKREGIALFPLQITILLCPGDKTIATDAEVAKLGQKSLDKETPTADQRRQIQDLISQEFWV